MAYDFVSLQAKERVDGRNISCETITHCLSDPDGSYQDKGNTVYWKDLPDATRVKVSVCQTEDGPKIANAIIVGRED